MIELNTNRLILRRFKESDLDDFFEYCQLQTVGPNAGWAPHESKERSFAILKSFIASEENLAIYHKGDKKVIGSIGIHKKTENNLQYHELGYVLSTPYEGKGLMTEAVTRILDYCFNEMKLKEIYVSHFMNNHKSERVIIKQGFKYLKDIDFKTMDFGDIKSKLYVLTKENYINGGKK